MKLAAEVGIYTMQAGKSNSRPFFFLWRSTANHWGYPPTFTRLDIKMENFWKDFFHLKKPINPWHMFFFYDKFFSPKRAMISGGQLHSFLFLVNFLNGWFDRRQIFWTVSAFGLLQYHVSRSLWKRTVWEWDNRSKKRRLACQCFKAGLTSYIPQKGLKASESLHWSIPSLCWAVAPFTTPPSENSGGSCGQLLSTHIWSNHVDRNSHTAMPRLPGN